MRFLNLLFWLVVAALATSLAIENWRDVTINLWGDLQADVKIPFLIAIVFLVGWLPAYIVYRTRLWRMRRGELARRPASTVAQEEEPE